MRHKFIKNRKQQADLKRNMKRKALTKAVQNLKRLERIKTPKTAEDIETVPSSDSQPKTDS